MLQNKNDNYSIKSVNASFSRIELLLGDDVLEKISSSRIILFGVGGVGSWCAEALVRSGVSCLTIVDPDTVNVSNINRQLPALQSTVGKLKVEVLKKRLLEINPEAKIESIAKIYSDETSASFQLDKYDYIIDAIDSLSHKAHLLLTACKTDAKVFASMGAGLKIDPTKIKIAEFWKVKGCKLAAALRSKFRKTEMPAQKIMCVYSEELLKNKGNHAKFKELDNNSVISHLKPTTNGTLLHITGIYGFMLASLVINDINNYVLVNNKQ